MAEIKISVHVDFMEDTPNGVYGDALIYTQDEFSSTTLEQIHATIAERVAAWSIKIQPVIEEVTEAVVEPVVEVIL